MSVITWSPDAVNVIVVVTAPVASAVSAAGAERQRRGGHAARARSGPGSVTADSGWKPSPVTVTVWPASTTVALTEMVAWPAGTGRLRSRAQNISPAPTARGGERGEVTDPHRRTPQSRQTGHGGPPDSGGGPRRVPRALSAGRGGDRSRGGLGQRGHPGPDRGVRGRRRLDQLEHQDPGLAGLQLDRQRDDRAPGPAPSTPGETAAGLPSRVALLTWAPSAR